MQAPTIQVSTGNAPVAADVAAAPRVGSTTIDNPQSGTIPRLGPLKARASTALWAVALQFRRSEGRDLTAHQLRECHRGGCAYARRPVAARSAGPAGGVACPTESGPQGFAPPELG